MSVISIIITLLYAIGLLGIFIYTLTQGQLVYFYLRNKAKSGYNRFQWSKKEISEYPFVTVQLPVYNERYVITRLIDAVADFQWPKERLEIQILDDSTDETVEIIAEKVASLKDKGFQIEHVRRESREGFKAGALEFGLQSAKGEFISIFDADFVPKADFLLNTVPHFEDKDIGMVQTRWGHLNQEYSILTRMQALALDAHFTVEQVGRNSADLFINFNGTAGVWRKSCIKDAGGWQHDTLTEDLDLSYRAQMKGWKFKYLEDVVAPAELPVAISALKTQQYRWTKGAAESARKHLGNVWKSKSSLLKKIQGSTHLLNSSVFIFILLISILSVPLLWLNTIEPGLAQFFKLASFFVIGLFVWVVFYGIPLLKEEGSIFKKVIRITTRFPQFLAISMALSVHNSIAVIKGYMGKSSPFVRTPKFNITNITDSWKDNKYLIQNINFITIVETFLTLYFLGGIAAAFILKDYGMLPFHILLSFGFGTISGYSIYEKIIRAT